MTRHVVTRHVACQHPPSCCKACSMASAATAELVSSEKEPGITGRFPLAAGSFLVSTVFAPAEMPVAATAMLLAAVSAAAATLSCAAAADIVGFLNFTISLLFVRWGDHCGSIHGEAKRAEHTSFLQPAECPCTSNAIIIACSCTPQASDCLRQVQGA